MAAPADISNVANLEGWHSPAFARGVRDNVIGEIGLQAVRIGGLVVLARALTPSDFGLFRVLITISAIIMMVNDLAAPDTLVQRHELTSAHESSAWWATISVSILTCAAIYFGAPLIARAMAMPTIAAPLRLLCIPILLEGSISVPLARLTRRLEFRIIAIAEVVAELAFLSVAIALLAMHLPRWSLAAGLSARMGAHAIVLWCAEPYLPRTAPSRKALLELRGFASGAFGGQIFHAISCNVDYLLVGRLLGSSALGFYGMAWDLLRFVPDRLYKVAGRVTLPAFCRMQHQPEQLRNAYLTFLGYMSRLIVPPLICIAIAAPELLRQIYGPHWEPAAIPLRILSFGIITVGLRAGMGPTFYALGRPVIELYLYGLRITLIVIAVLLTASSGLLWVCAGVSAVEAVCSVIGQFIACRMLNASLGSVTRALIPGFTTAAGCAAVTIAARVLTNNLGISGLAGLSLMVVLPGVAFLLIEAGTVREMLGSAFGSPASIDNRMINVGEGQA
jgi:O-antigen/teichoic acid export membrane protein